MRLRISKPHSEDVVEFFTYFTGMGIFSVAMYLLFVFPVLGVIFLPYTVMFLSFVFFDRLIKPAAVQNDFQLIHPTNQQLPFNQNLPEFLEESRGSSLDFGFNSRPQLSEEEKNHATKIEQRVA